MSQTRLVLFQLSQVLAVKAVKAMLAIFISLYLRKVRLGSVVTSESLMVPGRARALRKFQASQSHTEMNIYMSVDRKVLALSLVFYELLYPKMTFGES